MIEMTFAKSIHKITCIECEDKFDKYSGDMDERTCLTCILKKEDPETIKEDPETIKE